MRWPLIVCGVFLIVLALADLWRDQGSQDDGHDAHVPRAAWLLFAPSLVFFLVAPPALGAHFAERAQTAVVPVRDASEVSLPPLPGEGRPARPTAWAGPTLSGCASPPTCGAASAEILCSGCRSETSPRVIAVTNSLPSHQRRPP